MKVFRLILLPFFVVSKIAGRVLWLLSRPIVSLALLLQFYPHTALEELTALSPQFNWEDSDIYKSYQRYKKE